MTNWYALSGEEVLNKLTTAPHGLSPEEAARRLVEYGENKLPEAKTDSYLTLFLRQFASPLIYLLVAAAIVVYLMGDKGDAAIILFVLLFNAIIGSIQEGRAQDTLKALRAFAQTKTTVLRGDRELIISDCDVVPGDIVVLTEGAKVPADARVIRSHNLQVNEASLTGESEPVIKTEDALAGQEVPISDQENMVFKGSTITSGNGQAIVVATGVATHLGAIAEKVAAVDTDVPLKQDIRALSRAIIIAVAIGGTLLFGVGVTLGNSAGEMFSVAIALAVSVIPEGLPIVLTLVLATGVWRMGKRNVLVKRLQAVEALGAASIIAVDKTGTITRNEQLVERVWADGKLFSVTGAGYEPKGSVLLDGVTIDAANHPELLYAGKIAALTATAQTMYSQEEKRWRVSGDPTEAALLVFGQKVGFLKDDLEHETVLLAEMPFDYKLKYHATLHTDGEKALVSTVGAPEAILALCGSIRHEGKDVPLTPSLRKETQSTFAALSNEGLRVIAFATRHTKSAILNDAQLSGLTLGGFYAMRDGLRPEVHEAMRRAQGAGIKVVMITGDHALTATAIAREAGIYQEGDEVVTGEDIDQLNDVELAHRLERTTVFARVTPEHKMRIVTAYRTRGDITAMTGDGVNDAPPLVAADLGVAMGTIGTEVAKEAADLVLLDDNFGSIVSAVEEGRGIKRTIKNVTLYLLSTGVGEAITIIVALLVGLPLPLVAAQIIWLNFVTDGFLDVALAMEPKERGLLGSRFRRGRQKLVDRVMVVRILTMATTMAIGTLYLYQDTLSIDFVTASTMAMTTLAVFQWFNAWNCRSETQSLLRMDPFGNLWLIGATVVVITLQVLAVYTPFLQGMLHTTALTASQWVSCIAFAASILVVEEIRKLMHRRMPGTSLNHSFTPRTV